MRKYLALLALLVGCSSPTAPDPYWYVGAWTATTANGTPLPYVTPSGVRIDSVQIRFSRDPIPEGGWSYFGSASDGTTTLRTALAVWSAGGVLDAPQIAPFRLEVLPDGPGLTLDGLLGAKWRMVRR